MKKSIGILGITLLVVMVMTACGGTGSGAGGSRNLPPDGDGSINFASRHTFPVYYWDGSRFNGNRTFPNIQWYDEATGIDHMLPLSGMLGEPTNVAIEAGTLSLQLGRSRSAYLMGLSELASIGLTVTAGLRILIVEEFTTSHSPSHLPTEYYLAWVRNDGHVSFVYANRSGSISGEFDDGEFVDSLWVRMNWELRPGWNTVITTWTDSEEISVTGRPGNDFRWVVDNGPPAWWGGPSESDVVTAFSANGINRPCGEESAVSRLFR